MDKFVTMENMEALLPLIKQRFQNIENRLPIFIYKYFEPGVTDTNTGSVIRLNDKYMNQVISIEDDAIITSLIVKMNNEDITKQAYTGPFSAEIFGRVEGEEASYLRQGDSYSSGEITPDAGWGIKSISVQMGDDDITSEALSGHEVSVDDVMGDIAVEVETACEVVDEPFLSRITANGLTLANDRALLKGINGNTIVWNQIVVNGDFSGGNTGWGKHPSSSKVSFEYNNGAKITFNSEESSIATSNSWLYCVYINNRDFDTSNGIIGHVYYYNVSYSIASNTDGFHLVIGGVNGVSLADAVKIGFFHTVSNAKSSGVFTCRSTEEIQRIVPLRTATPTVNIAEGDSYTIHKYALYDLTAMFGAGNEPTLAEFESLYPLGSYTADAGRLLDFKGETLRSIGFNLWDEEWDIGSIGAHGVLTTGSYLRSKNAIPVLPSAQYYMTKGNNIAWVYFYGAGGEYLEAPFAKLNVGSGSFTTPAGTYYIRFLVDTTYGTTYRNNICINLSNTSLNGTYKPYSAQDITINPTAMYGYLNGEGEAVRPFENGMRSAGSVFDEVYKEDGKWYAKVNVGVESLGNMGWTYYDFDQTMRTVFMPKKPSSSNLTCSKYVTKTGTEDKTIDGSWRTSNRNITVRDSSYTDAATFKSAMDGVMLNYELATHRTYLLTDEWQQILNTAYQVTSGGMEIVLPENGSEPYTSPTKMEIQYGTENN